MPRTQSKQQLGVRGEDLALLSWSGRHAGAGAELALQAGGAQHVGLIISVIRCPHAIQEIPAAT